MTGTRATSFGRIRVEQGTATIASLGGIYLEVFVPAPRTGTLAKTLDPVTLSAHDGIHNILAKTLANITLAATGIGRHSGTLAKTLADVALVAHGKATGGVFRATISIALDATATARAYGRIVRRQNWPTILAQMIYDARCEPFVWGLHDCCIWAADVIAAMSESGVDLAATYRGTYSTALQAGAVISAATGGGDLEDLLEMIATQNGFVEVAPNNAQRGDLALDDTALGPAAGIIGPDGTQGAFVSPNGLVMINLADIRRTWRI